MDCTEIWKATDGFEGYEVSTHGRVFSLKTNKMMKLHKNRKGYLQVGLMREGKQVPQRVHRLVARAFIPNPNNYPQVNHKDENKANNFVNNLEWCTNDYNIHYGTVIERIVKKRQVKVNQYSTDGVLIKTWDGMNEAARALGIQGSHIAECCKGKLNKTGGFVWKYAERGCLSSNAQADS